METHLYTLTVYTEHQVGLLNQISIIFTRRGLNIESMTVSACSIPGVHKFTITCQSTRRMMELVVKQIEKRIDVLRAFLHTNEDILYQEVALYKVPTAQLLAHGHLEPIIRRHNARIMDITNEYIVLEKTGHKSETEALFEELKAYGIRQFVRSGRVCVTKNPEELVDQFLAEQADRKHDIEDAL